ncbi:MAG: WXG100 family type VII secretion target [Bifidobacteriaceae bacterium]|jgi:uncharacterized protein YukE|nr:WXG100 family type VII secretion target [Bifidobacteriaceae bacterium]
MSDATAYLTDPAEGVIDLEAQIEAQVGCFATCIDKVADMILGYSPLEEWVFKPFFGDWAALTTAGAAWRCSGQAVGAVISDLESLSSRVDGGWDGQSADAFKQQLAEYIESMQGYPDAAQEMAEMLDAAVECGQAAAECVIAAINLIIEVGMIILEELAIPLLGVPAATATAMASTPMVLSTANNAILAIKTALKVISKIKECVAILMDVLDTIQLAVKAIQSSGNLSRQSAEAISAATGLGGGSNGW